MSKILITGGSGLIGRHLTKMLVDRDHEVAHLGRSKRSSTVKTFVWDVQNRSIEKDAFLGVDTIVHLAGEGIADKRWTPQRKRQILESRTQSTRLLFEHLKANPHQVKTFVSASAIGYYGFDNNDYEFSESDGPGSGFLAEVVKSWEDEVDKMQQLGLRVVKIRVGIVLSMDGGALKEMVKPVRFNVGAPLGSGTQNLSWIHIEDLSAIFVKAIEHKLEGVYNGVGPYAVSNEEFTQAVAKMLNKPLLLPRVPSWSLRLLFGEMADLVIKGNKVSSDKLKSTGFKYRFKTLEAALSDLLI